MNTIVLTGGGSAGHVTPHLAIIPRFLQMGWDIHYIGSPDGIEKGIIVPIKGVTYHDVSTGKLRRYFDPRNFSDPARVIKGVFQARKILAALRPNVIFSKGGFVAVPVSIAAGMARVPLVLHESDLTPGLANKLSMPFAKAILTTFPETAAALGKKAVVSGTPLRPQLYDGERRRGLAYFGFTGEKPVLLMTGGSLGAQSVNAALRASLDMLSGFDIVHLCGKGNLDESLSSRPGYVQREYVGSEMADAYAMADVVLSRAGSNTIHELLCLKKPNVLIPYPTSASRGDQIDNAASFEKRGFSHVLLQENMTPESLTKAIYKVYNDREKYIHAMAAEPASNGTETAVKQLLLHARK